MVGIDFKGENGKMECFLCEDECEDECEKTNFFTHLHTKSFHLTFSPLTLCTQKPKIRLLHDASAARKPKIRLRGQPIINN